MSDLISANEIIEIASAHGYKIKKEQLARWRRHGLLTTVKRRFPGKGSEAYFLKSEVNKAIEIAALVGCKRNLDWVGWKLWGFGFDVRSKFWRPHLEKVFSDLGEVLAERRTGEEQAEGEWAKSIEESRISPKAPRVFKQLRKAILNKDTGVSDFETVMGIILDIASGEFVGFSGAYDPNDQDNVLTQRAFNRAFGLTRSNSERGKGTDLFHSGDYSDVFMSLAQQFDELKPCEFLSQVGDDFILEARTEVFFLRQIILRLRNCVDEMPLHEKFIGLKRIASLLEDTSIKVEAAFLAAWMIARRDSRLKEGARALICALQPAVIHALQFPNTVKAA